MHGFKIGQKVVVKKRRSQCSSECNDKIRTIVNMNDSYVVLDCIHGGVWYDEIILLKMKPNTEIEFLDAFKYNFREGV